MNTSRNRSLHVVLLTTIAVTSGGLRAAPGDVELSFDAPCRFPMGLATDGKSLFVANWRDAKVYAVSFADGKVTRSWNAPAVKANGLTYGDGKLFLCDDHTGTVYTLNLDPSLVERTFDAPDDAATGLAFADGELFILAKDRIFKVRPDDGTVLNSFSSPGKQCQCLAHDGKHLWVSDRTRTELYMVDPESGKVISTVKSPGPYPTGIVWVDGHLWNVDFQTRKLYKLSVNEPQKPSPSNTRPTRAE